MCPSCVINTTHFSELGANSPTSIFRYVEIVVRYFWRHVTLSVLTSDISFNDIDSTSSLASSAAYTLSTNIKYINIL